MADQDLDLPDMTEAWGEREEFLEKPPSSIFFKETNASLPPRSAGKSESTWAASRRHRDVTSSLPSVTRGMQASAHRSAGPRLQPNVINDPEDYVYAARRILHRQRTASKLSPRFTRARSATTAAITTQQLGDATKDQLDKADNVTRLMHASKAYQTPVFPGRRYTAEDVSKITDRLSTYDPEKVPESRGFPVALGLPLVYQKQQYTEEQVYEIVRRLSAYDPARCPPESRQPGGAPMMVTAMSRQTLGKAVRKCNSSQVQEIVSRLSRYNPWRWPPGSRSPALAARA